ncbi:hypothetical protein V8G69_04825 [Gaetbulibacter sp. M235]|uniref:hypothetical protein n=1 Tax=Gaetbulibacter sp. M235 TaxID=3126510 RepID=UPI00374EBA6C
MKTLIIHVGPPKCGSSSIQQFFETYKNPCAQKTRFVMLNPQMINSLNSNNKIDNTDFINLLDKNLENNDSLILSHESLFIKPYAIKNICSLSSNKVSKIIIIGFSRKSSDFVVSEYNQWGFRNPYVCKLTKKIMLENEINPLHFYGIERHLISSILNDFNLLTSQEMDWGKSYGQIEKLVTPYKVKMRAGILSNRNSSETLIQDFCNKADLTLQDKYKSIDIKSNTQFSSHLTESINNALEFGFKVPGPDEDNNILQDISKIINTNIDFNNTLIIPLKEYIDSYFYESNLNFCNKYGLDKSYFALSKKYSKNEILNIVRNEMQDRVTNNTMLNNYKELTGIMAEAIFHYNKIKKNVKHRKAYNFSFIRLYRKLKHTTKKILHLGVSDKIGDDSNKLT